MSVPTAPSTEAGPSSAFVPPGASPVTDRSSSFRALACGPSLPLLPALRRETQALHAAAERSRLMHALMRGRLPRSGYAALLVDLHAIYEALEAGLRTHAHHAAIEPLALAPLARLDAIERDLHALQPAEHPAPSEPARAYARRLVEVAEHEPERLVAHAYVRYLGDLSGGQMLAPRVQASYDLPEAPDGQGVGVAFYDFGTTEQVEAAKRTFREGLGRLPLDAAAAHRVVDEARWAFEQHRHVFEALAARWLPEAGTLQMPA